MRLPLNNFKAHAASLALISAITLTIGCSQENNDSVDAAEQKSEQTLSKEIETSKQPHEEDHTALPLPKRLAFMTGHVEAGLALYRAGKPEMGAPHLLHPVSETHANERVGLDALGFDGAVFEAVSAALESGRPASEIEPQLQAAENNLIMLAEKAGGDPAEIIDYLMDTVLEEYAIGVPEDKVTDMGEYQDSFGFTKVAIKRATAFEGENGKALLSSLESLLGLWPEAPIPPEKPASLDQIRSKVELVKKALANANSKKS